MARQTQWRRTLVANLAGDGITDIHNVKLCDLAPGETVTRIRFDYWIGRATLNLANEEFGAPVALGIQLYHGSDPTAFPALGVNSDWMWWEMAYMTTTVLDRSSETSFMYAAAGPANKAERDVRAQREAGTAPATLWLQTQTPVLGGQATHNLTVGASTLVLLPP